MGFPRLEVGQTRFTPYHSRIREASRLAHDTWKAKIRSLYAAPHLRVVRGNVTELFAQEARTLIGGMSGVRFIDTESLQTLVLFESDSPHDAPWVARFKCVDADFRTRNVRTAAQRAFNRQEDFPGVPSGSIYFTFAYQMSGPDADLIGPFIMLSIRGKLFWRYNVNDVNSGMELRYLDESMMPQRIRRVRPAAAAVAERLAGEPASG